MEADGQDLPIGVEGNLIISEIQNLNLKLIDIAIPMEFGMT